MTSVIFCLVIFGIPIFILMVLIASIGQNREIKFITCKYYGGFPDISNKKKCTITKKGEEFEYRFSIDTIRHSKIKKTKCSIITQTQLQEQVSLGKLVVFGIFALGMKNTKELTEEYCKVDITNEDKTVISIILKHDNITTNQEILDFFNKAK